MEDWVVQKWPSPEGEAEDLAASQFKELDGDGWARGTGDAFSIQGLEVLWGVAGLSPFEKHKKLESGVLGRSRGNGQTH